MRLCIKKRIDLRLFGFPGETRVFTVDSNNCKGLKYIKMNKDFHPPILDKGGGWGAVSKAVDHWINV